MSVNLQQFTLKAIVCYKLETENNFSFRYGSAIGFTSYIKTDTNTYFCYDDCMNLTMNNRDQYETRLLRNYYKYEINQGNEIEDEEEYGIWKDSETSPAKKLREDFKKDQFHYYTFLFNTQEVKEIAMRTGYLFIYSMDYDDYMKTKEYKML